MLSIAEAIEGLESIVGHGGLNPKERDALVLAITALNDRKLLTCSWCRYWKALDEDDVLGKGEGVCSRTGLQTDPQRDGCRLHTRLSGDEDFQPSED